MRKGTKKWINDLSCTLYYKGENRKCFAQDFRHMRLKLPEAVHRKWKLWCNMNSDSLSQISQNEWHGYTICATGERINYTIIDRKDKVKEAARLLGQVGGQAGYGKKKFEEIQIIIAYSELRERLKSQRKIGKNEY